MVIPGKFFYSNCNLSYAGQGKEVKGASGDVEILTCAGQCEYLNHPWAVESPYWPKLEPNMERRHFVEAGTEHIGEPNQSPEYVCSAHRVENNQWHSGKLIGTTCYYEYGGSEVATADFRVLVTQSNVYPGSAERRAGKGGCWVQQTCRRGPGDFGPPYYDCPVWSDPCPH